MSDKIIPSNTAKPLTEKQIRFTKEYIANGFNAKQAALEAGYSQGVAEHATKIIKNNSIIKETIIHAREQANRNALDDCGASYKARVMKLWRVVEDIIPDNGDIRQQHVRNAISAMAELNKMGGDYAPDKSLRLTVDMTKQKLAESKAIYDDV